MKHYLPLIAKLAVKREYQLEDPNLSPRQRLIYENDLTILDSVGDRIAALVDAESSGRVAL